MHDLIGEEFAVHQHVIDAARATAASYGCRDIATPLVERAEVFQRTLGDDSDVVCVGKERCLVYNRSYGRSPGTLAGKGRVPSPAENLCEKRAYTRKIP